VKATSTAKVRPALAAINRLGSDYFLTSHWQVPSAGGQGWPGTQLPAGPLVAYSCPHGAEETLACREVPGGDVRPYPAAAAEKEDRTDFVRKAVEREIERREKAERKS
jgi:hypothetical protein